MATIATKAATGIPDSTTAQSLAAQFPAAIDRAHLSRMTFGDRSLEQEVLQLFDRQAATDRARIVRLVWALRHFSSMGTALVATIFATGLVNIASIVGWSHVGALPQSTYGRLLIAMVVALVLMGFVLGILANVIRVFQAG